MLLDVTHLLLMQIHVVTGWTIPAKAPGEKDNVKLNILIDQLSRKLSESYGYFNAEEIMYAFRNVTGVKDWGKNVNLLLIDDVMQGYLNIRRGLSKIEESKWRPQEPEPISDDDFIKSCYDGYMLHKDFMKIPILAWKALEKKIVMTEKQKEKIRVAVTAHLGKLNHDACRLLAMAKYFEEKYSKLLNHE